jgi:RimJ/RimL family protein N-acetyltransferase
MVNIYIRPLELSDAKVSWTWRNDPEIWKFTGNKPGQIVSLEMETLWLQKVLNETNSKRFAIIVDDIYVGNIQLTNITLLSAEYHIFIGNKNFWGKGISFIASQQLIHFAKKNFTFIYIYLIVDPNNKIAINLYNKLGFLKISPEIRMELIL